MILKISQYLDNALWEKEKAKNIVISLLTVFNMQRDLVCCFKLLILMVFLKRHLTSHTFFFFFQKKTDFLKKITVRSSGFKSWWFLTNPYFLADTFTVIQLVWRSWTWVLKLKDYSSPKSQSELSVLTLLMSFHFIN